MEPYHRNSHTHRSHKVAGSLKKICESRKGMCITDIVWCLHISILMTRGEERQRATIVVINGGKETLLSAVRPCGMEVPSSRALNMSKSLYLTINYLPRGEQNNLEFKPHS